MEEINVTFGIRQSLLEDEKQRSFLREYLLKKPYSRLVVYVGMCGDYMLEIISYIASSYKPLDMTKFPKPESPEWEKAMNLLKESQTGHDVLWFSSASQAIHYIDSL